MWWSGIHRRVLWLYWIRFPLWDRLSHVLILIAGVLRLFHLRLSAGRAGQQQEKCQEQRKDMFVLRSHVTAPS